MNNVRTILPMPTELRVYAHSGAHDLHGNPQYRPERKTKCAVLKLRKSIADTTVRADSSATRGHAQEVTSDAWLLVAPNEAIKLADKLIVAGFSLKVIAIRPRFSVFGTHDHNEIEADIE